FSLMLLTGIMLTLLSIFELFPIAVQFSGSCQEIKASIPALALVAGQLESDTGSYIYQTNSTMPYFDGADGITSDDSYSNIAPRPAPISIGLLKDEIYFNAANATYSFTYDYFTYLTADSLMEAMDNMGNFTIGMYILLLIILLIFNLI